MPVDPNRLGALSFHKHNDKATSHQNECRACKKWRINDSFSNSNNRSAARIFCHHTGAQAVFARTGNSSANQESFGSGIEIEGLGALRPQVLLQLDALKQANCRKIVEETGSGASKNRPELADAIDFLQTGDTLVVWRLDRLARSLPQLIETIDELQRGVAAFGQFRKLSTRRPLVGV